MIKKCRTVIHPKWKGTASAICWMGLSRKFSHYLIYSAKTFTKIPGHFASFVSKTRDGAGDVIKKCISNMWKKNVEQYQDLWYIFFVHKKLIDNFFTYLIYIFCSHHQRHLLSWKQNLKWMILTTFCNGFLKGDHCGGPKSFWMAPQNFKK